MTLNKNPVGKAGSPKAPPVLSSLATPSDEALLSDEAAVIPRPSSLPVRSICRIVGHMTSEMVALVGARVQLRRDRRRTLCHVRQIAMYVCHVALQIPLHEIGLAFGRDRTTVGHACHVVEDRRDDPAFDDFVAAVERIVTSVFSTSGSAAHE
ncbi:helix-turn-helix domain-containing protein [Neorhizobium sp. P12A]|uniref:helix-turn-helix domain-containing protein n=1 Tax=Neorhizobium sp. P12A TaxID=2268027 RepID=UPI001FED82B9|nr:helix-turn-helix domain-containing protein [Neorhizobium sp. P12A]